MRNRKGTYFVILLYLIIFIFAYRKLFSIGMIAKGDTAPFAQNPGNVFTEFFYLWKPIVRGGPIPYTIYVFFQGVLNSICLGNSILAKKIYTLLPLPVACFGMYFLLGRITRTHTGRFLASFIYGVGPGALGNFLGGSEGIFYGHAILPFVVYSFLELRKSIISRLNYKTIYYHLLIFTILSALLYSSSTHNILFIMGLVSYLWLELIFRKEFKKVLISTFVFFMWGIFIFLLTAQMTYPFLSVILRFSGIGNNLQSDGDILSSLTATVKACFVAGGLSNTFRLIPQHFSFLSNRHEWELFGFAYPLLAFSPFIFKQVRFKKYVFLASLGALGLISFIWFTKLGWLVDFLYVRLPFLCNFRNPSRLVMWLSFFYATLAVIALEQVRDFFYSRRKKYLIFIMYSITAIAIAIYSWPVFLGDMGLLKTKINYREEGKIGIPEIFYKATSWLNNNGLQGGTFRTFWCPADFEPTQQSLTWLDRYWFNVPFGAELYNLAGTDFVKHVNRTIAEHKEEDLCNLLSLANIKYIIVNLTSLQSGAIRINSQYLEGDPLEFVKIFDKQDFLELVEDNQEFKIYYNTQLTDDSK